jgi:hypothetical protein
MLGVAIASEAVCLAGMIAWVIERPALSAPFTLVVPSGFATVAAVATVMCIRRVFPRQREGEQMSHFD